ncbi:MAG: cytochrome [Gammaproteobacteria bacterium]|nr:cytochrome [Gammaproteobacteria bacterium]
MTTENAVYWDPYRPEFWMNPYPVFKRLRQEAPLYRNEQYDFYALSRFSDVERGLTDKDSFSSSRGDILEYIKAQMPRPKGLFIWEDPPLHTVHRGVLSRVFTPRRMNELEGKIRAYCARCLDPLVGAGGFDFVKDLGAEMPMRVIGMLLGIPEEDQVGIREKVDAALRTEAGKPLQASQVRNSGEEFAEYIDWRAKHPSSDLMSDLLQVEFQDETGTRRKLTREEILIFVNLLAGAGNETTTRLIGWTGKVLSEHPGQRAELVENPTLIPNAIEELLRFEPPGPSVARYVMKDVEIHGQTVPAGTAMLLLVAAANRDESRYPDGDRFDIHRKGPPHITFGRGIHACLGAALARIEGRVALDEVLKRFPNWTADLDNAKLSSTSTVRGWDTLPAFTGGGGRNAVRREAAPAATTESAIAQPTAGTEGWELTLSAPMGPQVMTAHIVRNGESFSGTMSSAEMTAQEISGTVSGNTLSWTLPLTKPVAIKLGFEAAIEGDKIAGEVKLGMFGKGALTGKRI